MQKKIRVFAVLLVCAVVVTACNIYAPFQPEGHVEDYLEAAQACLHKGDYACAIEKYEKLPEGNLRSEKLCMTYLSKAGFGLNALLSTLKQNNQQMMGSLANVFLPWSDTKGTDAATAKTHCIAVTGSSAALLKNVGYIVDCAMRMAKTDQRIGSNDSEETCTTAGNQSGRVTSSDIGSTGTAGMCKTDVIECANDMKAVSSSDLNNSQLSDIGSTVDKVPANLRDPNLAVGTIRDAITSTLE